MFKKTKNIPTIRKKAFAKTPIWRRVMIMPLIYVLAIPLAFLDICAETYHQIGFRLYGIKILRRKDYIVIDRHRLKGLTLFNKIGCVYCGYANGLAAYFVAIAAETEAYWCAIIHQNKNIFDKQPHQKEFLKREKFEQ